MSESVTRTERTTTMTMCGLEELGRSVDGWLAQLEEGWHLESVTVDCDVRHVRSIVGAVTAEVTFTASVTSAKE